MLHSLVKTAKRHPSLSLRFIPAGLKAWKEAKGEIRVEQPNPFGSAVVKVYGSENKVESLPFMEKLFVWRSVATV